MADLAVSSGQVKDLEVPSQGTSGSTHLVKRLGDRECFICTKPCVQRSFEDDEEEWNNDKIPAKIMSTEESLREFLEINYDILSYLPQNKYRPDYWAVLCDVCTEWVDSYVEINEWSKEGIEVMKRNMKALIFSTMILKDRSNCPIWQILREHVFTGFTSILKKPEPAVDQDELKGIMRQDKESQTVATPVADAPGNDFYLILQYHDTFMISRGVGKLQRHCIICCEKTEFDQIPQNAALTEESLAELLNIQDSVLHKLHSHPQFGPAYWTTLFCGGCTACVEKYVQLKAMGLPESELFKNLISIRSIMGKYEGRPCPVWKQIREDALIGFEVPERLRSRPVVDGDDIPEET